MAFKILDLGSHDGFVTLWIARQLKERGIDVVICGMELHPGAVEIANRRAQAEGFDADYRVGLAENAREHWITGTFDAVVSFEVIEHVLDPVDFLYDIELMCKRDGGRVYLSTPNGCFGEGNNPHHLRTYRDLDLFGLCRTRGKVMDLLPGADGVTVIAYEPDFHFGVKPTAVVYCGYGWETWHPRDIETKGLGGSETAAARVAHELSEQGYAVTLYGSVEEGMWGQVILRHYDVFDPMDEVDLLVVSRQPWQADRKFNARKTWLWMHDTDYADQMTPERIDRFDRIMVLSNWHRDHVLKLYPWIDKRKVFVGRNGINPDYFPAEKMPTERVNRAIFSSSPDRGLDFLLELWPDVRERVPDAELVYCYSSVYDKAADGNPALAAFRDKVKALADQDGVVNLGSLPQDALASAMATCKLWLHPSFNGQFNVPFHETYCIGAVEAAAAGCFRIVSGWGALPERMIECGRSAMLDDVDRGVWIDAIVNSFEHVGSNVPDSHALALDWGGVASMFISA